VRNRYPSCILSLSVRSELKLVNYKETIDMKKNEGFNQNRTFGVEIEFFLKEGDRQQAIDKVLRALSDNGIQAQWEGYTHRTTRHWKLVYDSSVRYEGLEIVSPILKGTEGLAEMKLVTNALNEAGAKVDRSCGIHVHHDATDFTLKSFKNIYGMYARYEDTIDSMVSNSRRGYNNNMCKSPSTNLEILKTATSVDEIIGSIYHDRYVKLNCQSFRRHGTIEFRQHQGTTSFEKLQAWVVLTQMMVERSVNSTIQLKPGADDYFNFKKIIRGYAWMGSDEIQVESVKYMGKRIKELAA